jgi:hypothetical protein
MFSFLPQDMLFEIISYLTPDEIKTLYLSLNEQSQNEMKHYTVICKMIIQDDLVEWFQQNQIKVELYRECKMYVDQMYVDQFKTFHLTNGKVHSENDEPAVVFFNSKTQWWCHMWYKMGKLHRDHDDLFAVQMSDGYCEWYINGECIKKKTLSSEIIYL